MSTKKSDEEWKCVLNAEQYRVARLKGTEAVITGFRFKFLCSRSPVNITIIKKRVNTFVYVADQNFLSKSFSLNSYSVENLISVLMV